MACPSHIYSKMCKEEPNGQGGTNVVGKRTKRERVRDKQSERELICRKENQEVICLSS